MSAFSQPHVVTDAEVRASIEHTQLRAGATELDIEQLCEEALGFGFGGVCINPLHVARCRERLLGTGARVVTVIGFPLGAGRTECKVFEAELALRDGADELDMVMRVGAAKAGDWAAVELDARRVVAAAQGRPLKLIVETGLLTEQEKVRACAAAEAAGVAFVKTCTGFAEGRATVEDVALFRQVLGRGIGIKASGGIRNAADARALLAAGATRIGTSAGCSIALELDHAVR